MINLALCRRLLPYVLAGAVAIISAAGIYEAGYRSASRHYEAQIAADRLAQSQALAAAQAEVRQKEQESAKKVSKALAERDKALARAGALRRDAVRVHDRAESVRVSASRAAEASGASGDRDGERLGECQRLLGEGAELLGRGVGLAAEGAELSARVAADKDAMAATK